jgi:hypothetical protein
VRWLSRGNVHNPVQALKTDLEIFLVDQRHVLADKFTNSSWVAHLAYLADIFGYVNPLNKELQGKNINVITAREKSSAFGSKLLYWSQKAEQNKTAALPKLAVFLEDCKDLSFNDIKDPVIGHLTKLRKRFSDYFPDLDSHTVSWVVNPFNCEIADVPEEPEGLAEAFLELCSNNEACTEFQNKADLSFF